MIIKGNIALSENGFVFNPATGDSYTINNTGKEVLMLIKEGKDINQITALMLDVNLEKISVIERSRIIFDGNVYIPVSDQYKSKFQGYIDKNYLI